MRPGLADFHDKETADLEIEAVFINERGERRPLSWQFFYLLEKSATDIVPLVDKDYGQAFNMLRTRSLKLFVTDAKGKTKKSGLPTGTYFIFGVNQTETGFDVWNVQIDLKPGENSLVLDNKNMAERKP